MNGYNNIFEEYTNLFNSFNFGLLFLLGIAVVIFFIVVSVLKHVFYMKMIKKAVKDAIRELDEEKDEKKQNRDTVI